MSTTANAEEWRLAVAGEVRARLARRQLTGVKLARMIDRSQVYVSASGPRGSAAGGMRSGCPGRGSY